MGRLGATRWDWSLLAVQVEGGHLGGELARGVVGVEGVGEGVQPELEGGQVLGPEEPARAEAVVADPGVGPGLALHDGRLAAIPVALAVGQPDQQHQQRHVEQHAGRLAQEPLLPGQLAAVMCRQAVAAPAQDPAGRGHGLVGRGRGLEAGPGAVAGQVAATGRPGAEHPDQGPGPRDEAGDQGPEQGQVDGHVPGRAEDVEHPKALQHRGKGRVVAEVLVDPLGAEALLREQAAKDRGRGQHHQQDQSGPHGAVLAPGLAQGVAEAGPARRPVGAGGGGSELDGQGQYLATGAE